MSAAVVMAPGALRPAERPTMYFIGVTTGSSLIMRVFPRWAPLLGLDGSELRGIDLPVGAPADDYAAVVDFIAGDPGSLGALVTTHKLDLYAAARDRFGTVDDFAELMREVSSIAKRDGQLLGHAKDPISSALALDAFVPADHWDGGGRDAVLLGAGGASTAIAYALATRPASRRPRRISVTDVSRERLDALAAVLREAGHADVLEPRLVSGTDESDVLVSAAPAGSLVVNATGLGKDRPGSPLGSGARFPEGGLVWELNYRGDLVFVDQARAQQDDRGLRIEDGWTYFLHGWTQVIAEVFQRDIPTSGPGFDALRDAADAERGG